MFAYCGTFFVSGSIGNFGAELSTSDLNDLDGGVNFISFSYGAPIMPADISITSSKTTTLWSFNIVEVANNIWSKIKSWFK